MSALGKFKKCSAEGAETENLDQCQMSNIQMKELMTRTDIDPGGTSQNKGTNQNKKSDILKTNSTSAFLHGKPAEVSQMKQLLDVKYKVKTKVHVKATIQGQIYNFLERPTAS
ncbi:hypothetical protein CHS0354_023662 [Potamilus streckersoni]|uniref:Uncharacterized protein n=1 Tax=Potamilus streckersoni TaxID=2493646 RepID=A0AAE0SY60_9BIVA|nr:hypothetical protein CHS0354_023662 [Potamilus streckersoni]